MLDVLSKLDYSVPAFKMTENTVYVSKLIDGIEFPVPTLVNDSLMANFLRGDIQDDSSIVTYDTSIPELKVEFVSVCNSKEWQITILCNVEWIA